MNNPEAKDKYTEAIDLIMKHQYDLKYEPEKITNISQTSGQPQIMHMPNISNFTNLTQLWLNSNKIATIQCLWWMNMPSMRKLSFSYNKLLKIKIVRKMTCPRLIQLQLDHNFILEEDGFAEGKYDGQLQVWIYFHEGAKEKKKLNQKLNRKLYPFKMEE